jgi:putative redox protein
MSDEPRAVVVSSVEGAALTQRIEAGTHIWLSDEPAGTGDDEGPTPYDMLLAALGACTSMTVSMYAKLKKIPLEGVSVTLTYNRVHTKDCEDADAPGRRVHRMTRDIELKGLLTAEQRERLVEIAERCPVHRTLTEEKEIVTKLVG